MGDYVFTDEQLDNMSKFELNMAVAEKLSLQISDSQGASLKSKSYSVLCNGEGIPFECHSFEFNSFEFNPLENYNDCMPIAERFGTYMIRSASGGQARVLFGGQASTQPTIHRAIVYCFLKMED